MARISNAFVTGALNNIILHGRTGKSFTVGNSPIIKQSITSKKRSENFGIASSAAKTLRCGLNAIIPFATDKNMQSRFSGAIAKWLGASDVNTLQPCNTISFLNDFQFTQGIPLGDRFKKPIVVGYSKDNIITVSVDAFTPVDDIMAPDTTVFTELVICVSGCVLENGTITRSETQRIQSPYNYDEMHAQVLNFNIPVHEGSLTLVSAALQYYVMKKNGICLTTDTDFMPACVINASYK